MNKPFRLLPLLLSFCLLLTGCMFGSNTQQPSDRPETDAPLPEGTMEGDTAAESLSREALPAPTTAASSEARSSDSAAVPTGNAPGRPSSADPQGPSGADPSAPSPLESSSAPGGQIMTLPAETTTAAEAPAAYRLLSATNWADTVWTDSADLCHLRITDLTAISVSFYWHSRIDDYPVSFQSCLCTAAFSDNVISCDYSDDQNNSGVIKLTVKADSISFEQTIVHSGYRSPTALKLTLTPRASGTPALWFSGKTSEALTERHQKAEKAGGSVYRGAVMDYVENVLGITDIGGDMFYLLDSHTRTYSEQELKGFSKDLIKVFKNEIYARHGYTFQNRELYNLFLQFSWYYPDLSPDNFMETVFNQYEKENLKLLVKLEEK